MTIGVGRVERTGFAKLIMTKRVLLQVSKLQFGFSLDKHLSFCMYCSKLHVKLDHFRCEASTFF